MDWLRKILDLRSYEEDLRNDYSVRWINLYDSLKSEKKDLEEKIANDTSMDVQELNDQLNEIKFQLKKDKNSFLRSKKKDLFTQESTGIRNIKSWADLAKKRSAQIARQHAEDAEMAQRLADVAGVDDVDDMIDPFDPAVTAAVQQATRQRLADEEAERIRQLAYAAEEADRMAELAARAHDGVRGRGKYKTLLRRTCRRKKKHTKSREKKKKGKSKKFKRS